MSLLLPLQQHTEQMFWMNRQHRVLGQDVWHAAAMSKLNTEQMYLCVHVCSPLLHHMKDGKASHVFIKWNCIKSTESTKCIHLYVQITRMQGICIQYKLIHLVWLRGKMSRQSSRKLFLSQRINWRTGHEKDSSTSSRHNKCSHILQKIVVWLPLN